MSAMTPENAKLLAAWRAIEGRKPSFTVFAAAHDTTRNRVAGLLHRSDLGGKRSGKNGSPHA